MAANTTRHLTVSMAAETAAARSRAPVRFLAKIEGMVDETGTEWFDIGEKIAIAQRCGDSGGGNGVVLKLKAKASLFVLFWEDECPRCIASPLCDVRIRRRDDR